jgi:hypothetical protein
MIARRAGVVGLSHVTNIGEPPIPASYTTACLCFAVLSQGGDAANTMRMHDGRGCPTEQSSMNCGAVFPAIQAERSLASLTNSASLKKPGATQSRKQWSAAAIRQPLGTSVYTRLQH